MILIMILLTLHIIYHFINVFIQHNVFPAIYIYIYYLSAVRGNNINLFGNLLLTLVLLPPRKRVVVVVVVVVVEEGVLLPVLDQGGMPKPHLCFYGASCAILLQQYW